MLVQFITFHLRMIRREAYQRCGGYQPSLHYSGDYDLSLRLCELGTPIHLPEALYNYRLHPQNTSALQRQQTIAEAFAVVQAALGRRRQAHLHELHLDAEACRVQLRPRLGPVVVAGMHRSGTSVLALMLQQLGLDLGNQLLPADEQNPDGYGEDQAVVALQRRWLQGQMQGERGWPDWGWRDGPMPSAMTAEDPAWVHESAAYLEKRRRCDRLWGWKDPRSTLLLQHWLKQDPGLKVIGVYRDPWEVVESLQRVRPPVFLQHPNWGLAIWCHYNRALLQFARSHPERCILVSSSTLLRAPEALLEVLKRRWNWPEVPNQAVALTAMQQLIRPDRHRELSPQDPLKNLHRACSPEAWALLQNLNALADMPSAAADQPTPEKIGGWASSQGTRAATAELAIVITSHNQGDLLLEAVASVQRHADSTAVELLIVDDGSTEQRTLQVLRGLRQVGYRILSQANQGLPAARNAGLAATTAPVLLFLDDDNRLLAPYLTHGLEMLRRHPSLDGVYGNRQNVGLRNDLHRVGPVTPADLWEMNRIDNCALLRRSLLERCGGYNIALPALEDWDLWLTALGQSLGLRWGYLDATCFQYRVRPDSMLQRLLRNTALQNQLLHQLRERHGNRVGHGGFLTLPRQGA